MAGIEKRPLIGLNEILDLALKPKIRKLDSDEFVGAHNRRHSALPARRRNQRSTAGFGASELGRVLLFLVLGRIYWGCNVDEFDNSLIERLACKTVNICNLSIARPVVGFDFNDEFVQVRGRQNCTAIRVSIPGLFVQLGSLRGKNSFEPARQFGRYVIDLFCVLA